MEEISLPAGFTPGGLGGAAGGVNPEEMKAKQEQVCLRFSSAMAS